MPLPRTHRPAPFQRPGIVLSDGQSKRRWVYVQARYVVPGDIIRGRGLVVSGAIYDVEDKALDVRKVRVMFNLKNGTEYRADAEESIIAFTEAEGEPVG